MEKSKKLGVALVGLLLPSLVTWTYFVFLAHSQTALQQGAYALGKTIQFALPVVAWVLVLHWPLVVPRPTARMVGLGLGLGLAVLLLMLALYQAWFRSSDAWRVATDAVHAKLLGLGADRLWKYAALGVFYSLAHSLLEEYYWRWFVFGVLRKISPLWVAIVVSSVGFMAHHTFILATYFGWASIETVLLSAAVGIGGMVLAGLYQWSGNLTAPWLLHFMVDAGIFIIGYDMLMDRLTT